MVSDANAENVWEKRTMTREEAKAILYEWQKSMVDHGVPIDTSKVQALRVAIEALQADRPHGEWIEKNSHTYICDHCGFEQAIYGNLYEYNFCPNCGADMRGDTND